MERPNMSALQLKWGNRCKSEPVSKSHNLIFSGEGPGFESHAACQLISVTFESRHLSTEGFTSIDCAQGHLTPPPSSQLWP